MGTKPTINNVWNNIQDGALGISGADTDAVHVKIGVSSQGDALGLYSFTDPQDVLDTLGQGPLVEALALHLQQAGGSVLALKANASTAGTVSAVTATLVGTATGTIETTGSVPLDKYDVKVEITRTGTVSTGAFKYTLDGGDVYSAEIAIPSGGTYAIANTGITLTFTPGVGPVFFEKGDIHAFTATAPAMTNADLTEAFNTLLADSAEWAWVHVVGESTPTIAASVDVHMASAENQHVYAFAVLEARDVNTADDADSVDTWRTNLVEEYANFASRRVCVYAGHEEVTSPLTGRVHRRNGAWTLTARLAAIPVHEHPGRVKSGPLKGITSIVHDEDKNPLLDAAGFTTSRTIKGRKGFYVTNFRMMAPSGSDFLTGQNRRVMDKACTVARAALVDYLNDSVAVNEETGFILETGARAIDAFVEGKLRSEVLSPGHASAVQVTFQRDADILSTETSSMKIRAVPRGYLKFIEMDIGFINPALAAASA